MRRLGLFFILGFTILAFGTDAQKKIIFGRINTFTAMKRSLLHQSVLKEQQPGCFLILPVLFFFPLANGLPIFRITCVGYQPYNFYLNPAKDSITTVIWMERGTFNEGVKVRVRVNKGLLVWRKIVKNKDKNDRTGFIIFPMSYTTSLR